MKIRLFCTALLILGAHASVWAEDNAGVPTPEQLAEEEKKITAEEEQARRVSPLVVYDKRGSGPTKPTEEKKEQTASRDTNSKGFSFSGPSGGGSGSAGGLSGGKGKPFGSSAAAPGAPGASPPSGSGGPEKNQDGACQRGGYRENSKAGGIGYGAIKCQQQQLKDNAQLRNATGFALLPFVPAPVLKDQMDKLKK